MTVIVLIQERAVLTWGSPTASKQVPRLFPPEACGTATLWGRWGWQLPQPVHCLTMRSLLQYVGKPCYCHSENCGTESGSDTTECLPGQLLPPPPPASIETNNMLNRFVKQKNSFILKKFATCSYKITNNISNKIIDTFTPNDLYFITQLIKTS